MAEARRDLLNLSELPAGWTAQKGAANSGNSGNSGGGPGNTGNSGAGGDAEAGYELLVHMASCSGIPQAQLDVNPPTVSGPTFQSNDQTAQVLDEVSVFGSTSQAQRFQALWSRPRVATCLAQALSNGSGHSLMALPKDIKVGHSTGTVLGPSALQAGETGVVVVVPITYRGLTFKATIVLGDAARGRLNHLLWFSSELGPAPTALQTHLLSLIADP
jgi:hypothetical protein